MEIEKFTKLTQEQHKKYYNKYFAGQKFVEPIVYERLEDCILYLAVSQGKFLLLLNSLYQLKEDKPFYKTYPKKSKQTLKNTVISLKWITSSIDEILTAFLSGFTD